MKNSQMISRRRLLLGSGAVAISSLSLPLWATPHTMRDAMRKLFADKPILEGRVTLDIPALAENGNSVSMTVEAESPMSENDHVKAIHIFSEKNPLPNIVSFYLEPECGRAKVATRIRLSDTQVITAVAQMRDGSLWSASTHTVVTLAACIEDAL